MTTSAPSGQRSSRQKPSLYERLGGSEGISAIVNDIIDLHLANPRVSTRFRHGDLPRARRFAPAFFCAGTGGPEPYEGKDMRTAHAGMNTDAEEFVAVLDDVLLALHQNGVGAREKEEVLAVLYSMKGDIVHV